MKAIGIIVNNTEMYMMVKKASKDLDYDFEVVLSHTYNETLEWAKRLEQRGFRILISRGGHSSRIREANLGIPIVDIPFTGNDIASLLIQAQKQYGEFGVVGNCVVLQMAKELERALGGNIKYFEVKRWEDFELQIQAVKKLGIKAVVGGYDATSFAEREGLKGICVTTNEFEIKTALYEAQKLLEILDKEKRWNEIFRKTLDSIREGIVLLDERGVITHINQPAKKLLDNTGKLMLGSTINDTSINEKIVSTLKNGDSVYDEINETNGYQYTSSILPIQVSDKNAGAVFVLQESEYVRKIEQKIRYKLAKRGLVANCQFKDIEGRSDAIKNAIQIAKQYSSVDSTVLIYGESGTGKELFAQSIHNASKRKNEAFVAINCASIPINLLESELFGYAEGAFTGAKKGGKIGLFELAHNGTIFLDEIGEISNEIQARLLRVLEEKQIMRIGDDRVIPVNIRVIAATNRDLKKLVENDKFRSDFYYRLNVLSMTLPSLRERKEDLKMLIEHFADYYTKLHGLNPIRITSDGMADLLGYEWPGNVREIRNIIERLVVINAGSETVGRKEMAMVMADTLNLELSDKETGNDNEETGRSGGLLDKSEKDLICKVLKEVNGNKSKAAQRLGISRVTLYRKIKEMNIDEN